MLVFAAADPLVQRAVPWPVQLVDRVLGLERAHAHAWTGRVWRVQRDGRDLRALIAEQLTAPVPAPSPDGTHLAVLSLEGVRVLDLSTNFSRTISLDGGNGGIAWTR